MDEIQKRLKETSENCISAYEKWAGAKKDIKAIETLRETVHELRKASSRVEIELAVSERDENALKPMPIPPHRSSQKPARNQDDSNDNAGNRAPPPEGSGNNQQRGGSGGGGGRRQHHGGGKKN